MIRRLLPILCVVAAVQCHSPAILWPADEFQLQDGQSALETIPMEDFQKMFQNKKVVIFHKRNFAMEDVSYPVKPLRYLQTVDAIGLQGVKSVHRLLTSLTASDSLKIVPLDDGDLSEQDQLIKDTMEANPCFAAILIGSGSGSRRSRRAADDAAGPVCQSQGEGTKCLVYVGSVKKVGSNEAGSCKVSCDETSFNIEVTAGDISATILVNKFESGYKLSVDGDQYRLGVDVDWAPEAFSYSCTELRIVPTGKNENAKKGTIVLGQVQLWNQADKTSFPTSFDCAVWFTPQLWMGLSISLFYLAILFVAILFLLDVKTNDRFDDPKGKTITVNVSE